MTTETQRTLGEYGVHVWVYDLAGQILNEGCQYFAATIPDGSIVDRAISVAKDVAGHEATAVDVEVSVVVDGGLRTLWSATRNAGGSWPWESKCRTTGESSRL
jgi:hypothetical protein